MDVESVAMGAPKRRRKEGGMGGKKGALGGVSIPRIKYSAGRREIIGFLGARGRSFSRERVRSILWRAGLRVWRERDVVMRVLPFDEADEVETGSG